jgi:hypothetical protein
MQVLSLTATEHMPMDLNCLYHRHQVSMFMSENGAFARRTPPTVGSRAAYAAEMASALCDRRPAMVA